MKTTPLYVQKTFDAMLREHGIVLPDDGGRVNNIDYERLAAAVESISGIPYDQLCDEHVKEFDKEATVREILLFAASKRWKRAKELVRKLMRDARRATADYPDVFFDDLRRYGGAKPAKDGDGLNKATLNKGPTAREYLQKTPAGKAAC